MIHDKLDSSDPEQVALVISEFANNYSFEATSKKLAEILTSDKVHRVLQTHIFKMFMTSIKYWAEKKDGVDGRNQGIVDRCVEIMKVMEG